MPGLKGAGSAVREAVVKPVDEELGKMIEAGVGQVTNNYQPQQITPEQQIKKINEQKNRQNVMQFINQLQQQEQREKQNKIAKKQEEQQKEQQKNEETQIKQFETQKKDESIQQTIIKQGQAKVERKRGKF